MPQYACTQCGVPSDEPRCRRHRRDPNAHWSPNRRRRDQERFRVAVLDRDGHQCTALDPETSARCTRTTDLRACHLRPLRDFEDGDPAAYDPANGTTRCGEHDQATDRYARRATGQQAGSPAPIRLR